MKRQSILAAALICALAATNAIAQEGLPTMVGMTMALGG
jgi:hypothetical protein